MVYWIFANQGATSQESSCKQYDDDDEEEEEETEKIGENNTAAYWTAYKEEYLKALKDSNWHMWDLKASLLTARHGKKQDIGGFRPGQCSVKKVVEEVKNWKKQT